MNINKFEASVDSLKGSINGFRASLVNFKKSAEDVFSAMSCVKDSVIGIKTETASHQFYEIEDLMNLTGEMFYDAESNIRDIEIVKDILLEDSDLILDILDEVESLGEIFAGE